MAAGEINKLPPSLPPYPQMILSAIESLNEQNGSNKTSISKYIESEYGQLPGGHTTLLSNHLTRMKESGDLVFWKNNYMKHDPNAPPRRGRGRPPKAMDPLSQGGMTLSLTPKDPNAPNPIRPRLTTGSGKPRGRPRKMARPSGGMMSGETTTTSKMVGTARGRGRPPKVKAPFTEMSVEQ
ncbi:hypothetical protein Dsin_012426 [Dipteronia sinensis]|uniref:HMG-Y-related protein A n=1 Tax=Dipteronia sinensis TaxID=43782 RepID=A0AAE0AI04_9ROSI|nr:hypothetical protein Dsin_012426 [Dipteronia sinensis]